ncbi:hypothetical protein AVEN_265127-1 [Araneus ventricosus]|uniref:Uncharacterized protein n=1 Tax=Araneus ventricosus TaxID=182803 RepID=A0A4Y2NHB3_ARAVE|nr:hypothetical protein AVEN_265127-1 [Araneus ventricosus]
MPDVVGSSSHIVDENPPKRTKWGPAKLYMPEEHNVQPPTAAALEVRFAQPSTTTAAPQPSTASKMRFVQPPTAVAVGSPLRRDQRRTNNMGVGRRYPSLCGAN